MFDDLVSGSWAVGVRGVLIDLGGVLSTGVWPDAVQDWAIRLGLSSAEFLTAVFGGSDHGVLVGRVSEDDWWRVVAGSWG